jgi:SAM-dependent methyltransferase
MGQEAADEAKGLVRSSYDRISYDYRDDTGAKNPGYPLWLQRYLLPRLPAGSDVLDLGCGNGIPATRILAERHRVVGVDFSHTMIERARRLVPSATFIESDMVALDFPPNCFDAIVSFFALIHVPVAQQPALLDRVTSWLRPGGWLLATVGARAWTGTEDNWHGAPMFWSHADGDTYRAWVRDRGMAIVDEEFIPEGDSGHLLILARKDEG